METKPEMFTTVTNHVSCQPACRIGWLKNKGALLVALWNCFVTPVYYLLKDGQKSQDPLNAYVNGIILLSACLLYPIGGWLADSRFGRYKIIRCSIWIMWICVSLATLAEDMTYFTGEYYNVHIKEWLFMALCITTAIGYGGFSSNIFQLGIDQLNDASANEISSYILWYVLAIYTCAIIFHFLSDCIASEYNLFCIKVLIVGVSLTVAICMDFLCKQWLVKEKPTMTSVSKVVKVIRYVIKNRRLRHDFVANDTSELPSVFDIAKHHYGGPFRAKQVDDIRTFLWILLILAICVAVFGAITPVEYAREKIQHRWNGYSDTVGLSGCYNKLLLRYEDYIFIFILFLSYEFLIRPIFYRCLPHGSIIGKFIIGTGLLFLWILSLLAIETVAYAKGLGMTNDTEKCIFQDDHPAIKFDRSVFLIPDILSGASRTFLYVTAVEFIWAQSPSSMKGLVFGCAYVLLGLNTLLHSTIATPFLFNHRALKTINWRPLTCGMWYFIMEGAIVLAMLVVIIMAVKRYKKKNRYETSIYSD